jgi:hypothetical protein
MESSIHENRAEAMCSQMSANKRSEKVVENILKTKELHQAKMMRSAQQFRDARVTSCSGVLLRNGNAICVAFPNPNPKPMNIAA